MSISKLQSLVSELTVHISSQKKDTSKAVDAMIKGIMKDCNGKSLDALAAQGRAMAKKPLDIKNLIKK